MQYLFTLYPQLFHVTQYINISSTQASCRLLHDGSVKTRGRLSSDELGFSAHMQSLVIKTLSVHEIVRYLRNRPGGTPTTFDQLDFHISQQCFEDLQQYIKIDFILGDYWKNKVRLEKPISPDSFFGDRD